MPSTQVVSTQADFSAGEIDSSVKRSDQTESIRAVLKSGARQCSNGRILNSNAWTNRMGRRALFIDGPRVEKVLMVPGSTFYLIFGNGTLKVRDSSGTQVFSESGRAWATATVKSVAWAKIQKAVYITFPGAQPRVLSWDGVSTWSAADFAENVAANGRKQTPFYRLAAPGITMALSALTGSGVTVTFSAAVLNDPGHIGTRMRYYDRQILITAVASPTSGTCTIEELLRPVRARRFADDITDIFSVGDVIENTAASGERLYVATVGAPTNKDVIGLRIGGSPPAPGDNYVGPSGDDDYASQPFSPSTGPAITVWDEEVMNDYRGWPASVFVDQNRLGFCNFPALPGGIGWSASGIPTNFEVGANPTDGIFELAPSDGQVFFVVAGPESSEFVFCDNAIWYIPITPTNPLKPGSVGFQNVTNDGCLNVQPRAVEEAVVYLSSGLSVNAIMAIGDYNRPYKTHDLTLLHNHLFDKPIAIAIPSQQGTFPERYAYVLNSDGSIVVGKYTIERGIIKSTSGWIPWSGVGTVSWVAALGSDVIFTTAYAPNAITPVTIAEVLDETLYLDGAMLVNAAPTAFAPPPTKGPLWWMPGGTVDLMDQSTRMMGTYTIDANGFIVPQGNAGEDLTAVTLVAGQAWTAILEPFISPVQHEQDVGQRMWPRRIARAQVYVQNSTGFVMARLYSGQSGPNLPALGTIMKQRRIATWNVGEDPTLAPPLREQSYLDRPIGRSHDPRHAIIKDTPGPLTVMEVSYEVSV